MKKKCPITYERTFTTSLTCCMNKFLFNSYFQIISQSFKGKTINSLSNDLLETGKLLEEVTPARQECLRTFTSCHYLVTWLRESIKGKQSYLTVKIGGLEKWSIGSFFEMEYEATVYSQYGILR